MDTNAGAEGLPTSTKAAGEDGPEVVFKGVIRRLKEVTKEGINGTAGHPGDSTGAMIDKDEEDDDGTIEYDDKNPDDIKTLERGDTPERIPGRRISRGAKKRSMSQDSQPAEEVESKEEVVDLPIAPSSPALDVLRREPRAKMCMSPGKPPGSPTAAVVSSVSAANGLSPGFASSKTGARKSISSDRASADKQMVSILKPVNSKRESTPHGDTDKENISQEKGEKESEPVKEGTGPSPTTTRQADIRTMLISQGVKGARARIGGKRTSLKLSPKRSSPARSESQTKFSKSEDGEQKTLAKQGSKAGKKTTARKSCQGGRTSSADRKSESPSRISGSNLANLTLRLKEIERTLGIKSETLSKIDAKTLDKLILEKANMKSRETTPNPEQKPGSKNSKHPKGKVTPSDVSLNQDIDKINDSVDSGDEFATLKLKTENATGLGSLKVGKAKKGFSGTRTKASLVAKLKPKSKVGRLKGFGWGKKKKLETQGIVKLNAEDDNGWKDESETVVNSVIAALDGKEELQETTEGEVPGSDVANSDDIKSSELDVALPLPRRRRRRRMGTYNLPNARKNTPQKTTTKRKFLNSEPALEFSESAPEGVDVNSVVPDEIISDSLSQESDLDSSMVTEDEHSILEDDSIPAEDGEQPNPSDIYLSIAEMKRARNIKRRRQRKSWTASKVLKAKRAKYNFAKHQNAQAADAESSAPTDTALHVITGHQAANGAELQGEGETTSDNEALLKVFNNPEKILENGPSEPADATLDAQALQAAENSRRSRRKRKTNEVDSETSVSDVSDITVASVVQESGASQQAQPCSCQCFHRNHRHRNHRHNKKATKAKRRKLSQDDCNALVNACPSSPHLSPLKLEESPPDGCSSTSPTPPVISPQKPLAKKAAGKKSGTAAKSSGAASGEDEEEEEPEFPPEIDVRPDIPLSKFVNTPNGITYPVTPPRTPEQTVNNQLQVKRYSGLDQGHEFIPLCCCKISGAMCKSVGQVVYCQALDSIDGKVVGCCNKVNHPQLVRPAVKIPFMAVCESHRKRLKMHQCCPGCGHFCTQGKFYQCRKEGSGVHHFHKQCQVYKDNKFYCPHCGEESLQYEAVLKLSEPHNLSFFVKDESSIYGPRAKMSYRSPTSSRKSGATGETDQEDMSVAVSLTLKSTGKTISTAGLPLGPSLTELENALTIMDGEKPKTLRAVPKSLYKAARSNELEKLLFMLSEGIDPNHKFEEHNGQTALHAAAGAANLTIVHILLQAGAMPDILDKELRTPLMCAAEVGKVEVMKALIDAGANTHTKGEDGMTTLHISAKNGHVECLKYLLYHCKVDVNLKDDGGWTPIIWSSEYGHVETVKFLMTAGADPNIRDNEENTGLHWAAYAGSVDIAELYLNAGCNLEAANEHGDRVLHIAARQDHYECVVLFLARGADSEARNNENEAPIGCCADQNSKVWMALRVNRQLKTFAAQRLSRPERLLHRDVSMGREANAMPVVNDADDENYPTDFQYVIENVETSPMNINRVITSLQSCRCKDDCGSMFCICGRNSVRCWYDKEGRLVKEFNMLEPPLLFECNKACKCWVTCQNRVVQLGITCRLQVFRTNGRGWGCRTLLDIQPGTFVCEYIGEYISDAEADSREDDSYLFDLDNKDSDTFCIDARRYGNVSRFVNHLCEPNLIPVKVFCEHQDLRFPRICFFASRLIKAGEELGFDYGEKFWIIKWKQFTCECGSPKCKYSKDTIQQTIADYNKRQQEEEALENA